MHVTKWISHVACFLFWLSHKKKKNVDKIIINRIMDAFILYFYFLLTHIIYNEILYSYKILSCFVYIVRRNMGLNIQSNNFLFVKYLKFLCLYDWLDVSWNLNAIAFVDLPVVMVVNLIEEVQYQELSNLPIQLELYLMLVELIYFE